MKIRMRISPDGKEFKHIYNDALLHMDRSLGKIRVDRASDVFFDNKSGMWKIKVDGEMLPSGFSARADALAYEHIWLEENRLSE